MIKYVVVSSHDWYLNIPSPSIYDSEEFHLVGSKVEFENLHLRELQPDYIFFIHWNWIVSSEIYSNYKCIVFHTAPLPYGRGGSPIQNLILNGYKSVPLNAIEMVGEIDGGGVFASKNISLEGTIEQIFDRAAVVVQDLITYILAHRPLPTPQIGEPTYFKRLERKDNALKERDSLEKIYDKIRMVDGLNYPRAHIDFGEMEVEFTDAVLTDNSVVAKAIIKLKEN